MHHDLKILWKIRRMSQRMQIVYLLNFWLIILTTLVQFSAVSEAAEIIRVQSIPQKWVFFGYIKQQFQLVILKNPKIC